MSRFMLGLRQAMHRNEAFISVGHTPSTWMGDLGGWIDDESDADYDEELTFAAASANTSVHSSLESHEESWG